MGMYYKYKFEFNLKPNLPQEVINFLNYLSVNNKSELTNLPNHKLFLNDNWVNFRDGTYFEDNSFEFKNNNLWIVGTVKNCASVIEDFVDFIDFIDPYIDEPIGNFIGSYVIDELYDYDCLDDSRCSHYTKFYKRDKI